MQTRFLHSRTLGVVLGCVSLVGASQTGCGLFGGGETKQTMLTSAEIPAGEGTVRTKLIDNGNTQLKVEVKHLAPPAKVASGSTIYVVWVQPQGGRFQNVGALTVNDDLVGELDTTTPHRVFTVTVTPEPNAQVGAPTNRAVFSATVHED